jgi:hypothetical protein
MPVSTVPFFTFLYELKIGNHVVTEKEKQDIEQIVVTLRRNESSSLSITFVDTKLYWHRLFDDNKVIPIYFKGMNLDESNPEEFYGNAYLINPKLEGTISRLEVVCIDVPIAMSTVNLKPQIFKAMSRKAIVQQLASKYGATVDIEESSYLNQIEKDITFQTNESAIEFLGKMLDDVGYRISVVKMKKWIVTGRVSTKDTKKSHSNLGNDGSLLSFEPSLNSYRYPDQTNGSGGSGSVSGIDEDPAKEQKLTPEKVKSAIDAALAQAQGMYDAVKGVWNDVKK